MQEPIFLNFHFSMDNIQTHSARTTCESSPSKLCLWQWSSWFGSFSRQISAAKCPTPCNVLLRATAGEQNSV